MATANNTWMPASGRHRVGIGSSLGRALKARKGGTSAPTKRASNLPSREFYSFRYHFKPPSIDNTRPGSIEVNRGKETTNVTVEHPSTQEGESLLFIGPEEPAKEFDCVLVYDEETGTFTLEKLESSIALKYEKKTTSSNRPRPSASPLPPTPAAHAPPSAVIDDLDFEAQLEDILHDKDAEGEPDEQLEEVLPAAITRREEEEEEEETIPPPRPPSPPKRAPPKTTKANGKLRAEVPPKTKPQQPKNKQVKQAKAPPPHATTTPVYADEEVFEFGTPSVPVKQNSQTSAPSEGLALPGSTSTFIPPPPGPSHEPSAADSDEDIEWDVVAAVSAAEPVQEVDEGEEEEIDLNDLEAQIDAQLGASDDDIWGPEPEQQEAKGPPISLHRFAAGEEVIYPSQDEDDYTSSEDSDDD